MDRDVQGAAGVKIGRRFLAIWAAFACLPIALVAFVNYAVDPSPDWHRQAWAAGFVLLTLSLFTGFVFVTNLFTQHLIHKTVLSLIAWTIFGVLLIGRIRFGSRGRSAVGWTLSGFGVLALAYFGAKFVLEDVLGRHWG